MRPILNRTRVYFVILLSLLLAAGCSSDPSLEADRAIERANEDISAHDRLFDEARGAYSDAQQTIRENNESSENTDNGGSEGESTNGEGTGPESEAVSSISEARGELQDARGRLEEARGEISSIQDLEVSEDLLEYSRTLQDAISAQMRAEEREIAFYEILAEDPALEEDRERATELLDEAGQAYTEAENGYQEANSIANSNPRFVAPENG